ncbi:uncharacterized protein LOC118267443 isoform X2 [Spodoptera frugiperda]|uniref:Uncharacterized protein LOC118267443 isoform X2 n=2 Tax=Spodoptera frugiperda TaxID=7108 RepID=A0A9R0EV56_SPOFR|nr:uncharacterized protein LOC118267443 isoform X2 [Spodoptera frugiperda]
MEGKQPVADSSDQFLVVTNCCFCFDLRTGSLIIVYFTLITSVLNILGFLCDVIMPDDDGMAKEDKLDIFNLTVTIVVIIICIMNIATCVICLLGIYQDIPEYVYIYLIYSLVYLVVIILLLLASVITGRASIGFYFWDIISILGPEVDSDTSLNDYLRNHLNLRGTKYMCKEGGCGACVVAVTVNDPHRRTFSVNSCLVSITSCQDWEITTIEGIGNRARGYHPVQRTLAEYNGTQCGYCSPGFVMSMYSLLEANHYDLTQYEIENSFGSNTCRCTGSRPILDAFKSFAKDAPKPPPKIEDIEDLKICPGKGDCKGCGKDKNWCMVSQSDVDPPRIKKINLKDGHVWYRVNEVADIFTVLDAEGYESYMLVNGNTGRGAVPVLVHPRVLIDIQPIKELKGYYLDQNLVVGAGITLTDLMELFKDVSKTHEEFQYLYKLYEHLDLVAHIPVRNIGTVAGNLMTKYRLHAFSSDIFLLLETIGAVLVIGEYSNIKIK